MATQQRSLTPKQMRFVEEYLLDLNATAAARRAGYSERRASEIGHQLLQKTTVRAAISAAQAERSRRTEITADQVLREIARIAFSDLGQVLDFSGEVLRLRPGSEISEDARRAISSIKVRRYTEGSGEDAREVEVAEFKMCDKLSALDKLGRHFGMFKEVGSKDNPLITESTNHVDGKIEHEHSTAERLLPYRDVIARCLSGEIRPDGVEKPVDSQGAEASPEADGIPPA